MNLSPTLPEPSCIHEHKPVEAVCPRCGLAGDAICPHCRAEYECGCVVESEGLREKFANFTIEAIRKRNTKFWLCCYLIATGHMAAGGVSMVELGRHFGVTKACVSKTCVAICRMIGQPPSRYMRRECTRQTYRARNRRNQKAT